MNPRKLPTLSRYKVIQVAAGESHSLALMSTGDVFSWGRGKYGRLGLGHERVQMVPTIIEKLQGKSIMKIAAGNFYFIIFFVFFCLFNFILFELYLI